MKALLLNSGIGSRIAHITKERPKCLIEIAPDLAVIDQQVQHLLDAGITESIITTGLFAEKIKEHLQRKFPQFKVNYVHNQFYRTTNYIYSLYLTRKFIDDDVVLIHGDLVFAPEILARLLKDPAPDAVAVDSSVQLPEKDFKGRIKQGYIREISINTFGPDCHFVAPIYKLSCSTFLKWLARIEQFILEGNNKVHAENALNQITDSLQIRPVLINGLFCSEIDTQADLDLVRRYWQEKAEKNP